MKRIDEAMTVKAVNGYLESHGFTARDADKCDFQYGDDTTFRFKTGTVHGEVAIQVVGHGQVRKVIRVLTNDITKTKHELDRIIATYQGRVEPWQVMDGDGNVIAQGANGASR